MKVRLRRAYCLLSSPIVIARDTFAEVVRLHEASVLSKIVARPFKVNLVFVVTHKDTPSSQTSPWRCLDLHINTTKKEVFIGPNVRCIIALDEGKVGTIRTAERDVGIISQDKIVGQGRLLREITHEVGIECRN